MADFVFQFDADNADAMAALQQVARGANSMGRDAATAAESARSAFDSMALAVIAVESAVTLTGFAFEALSGGISAAVREAVELRGENDRLVRQLGEIRDRGREVVATIGNIVLEAVASTNETGNLENALAGLRDQIADSNTEIGMFVREGLATLVSGAQFALEGMLRVVQGFTGIVNLVRVARERLTEGFLEIREALVRGDLANALDRLDRLERASQALGRQGQGVRVTSILGFNPDEVPQLLEDQRRIVENLDRQVSALNRAEFAQESARRAAVETAAAQLEAQQGLFQSLSGLSDLAERFRAGLFGDVDPARVGGNATAAGLDAIAAAAFQVGFAADAGVESVESFVDSMKKIDDIATARGNLGAAIRQAQIGVRAARGDAAGGEQGGIFGVLIGGGLEESLERTGATLVSGLNDMSQDLGRFLVGSANAFRDWGESVKGFVGNTFASIGNAFSSAAVQALATGAGAGPFGAFLGIGALFSLAAGLLTGGGRGSNIGPTRAVDTLQTIRPEVTAGVTQVTNLSIGAVFPQDEGRRIIAGNVNEAIVRRELQIPRFAVGGT